MKLSKKILVLLFLIGTLFLTACGIEVSTDMNLEEGFQGKRVISCFVSTQDMNTYVKGDITKIDSILEHSCTLFGLTAAMRYLPRVLFVAGIQ